MHFISKKKLFDNSNKIYLKDFAIVLQYINRVSFFQMKSVDRIEKSYKTFRFQELSQFSFKVIPINKNLQNNKEKQEKFFI